MESIKTKMKSGKYTFEITDNTLLLRDQIYSRNFKIGGKSDCVNVSISYKDNIPVSASIPHLLYEPECSMDIPLDRGHGSIIMIKTLLRHIHEQIPTLTHVNFEDKSNIECATDMEIQKKGSRFRKVGTNVYPIPLYYFTERRGMKNISGRDKNTITKNTTRKYTHCCIYQKPKPK